MSEGKYAVIGIGKFGKSVMRKLTRRGAEVLAIDINETIIDEISDEVAYAVTLDATNKKALISQNIHEYDAVVIAIGTNFEQLLLCAVNLLDLKVKRIISRAGGNNQKSILQKMGVEEIVIPENEAAAIVTEKLLNPNIISYLQLADEHQIVEIKVPTVLIGRTVGSLNLRDKYNLSLVTISRLIKTTTPGNDTLTEKHTGVPKSDVVLTPDIFLLVFGKRNDIERFIEINN